MLWTLLDHNPSFIHATPPHIHALQQPIIGSNPPPKLRNPFQTPKSVTSNPWIGGNGQLFESDNFVNPIPSNDNFVNPIPSNDNFVNPIPSNDNFVNPIASNFDNNRGGRSNDKVKSFEKRSASQDGELELTESHLVSVNNGSDDTPFENVVVEQSPLNSTDHVSDVIEITRSSEKNETKNSSEISKFIKSSSEKNETENYDTTPSPSPVDYTPGELINGPTNSSLAAGFPASKNLSALTNVTRTDNSASLQNLMDLLKKKRQEVPFRGLSCLLYRRTVHSGQRHLRCNPPAQASHR